MLLLKRKESVGFFNKNLAFFFPWACRKAKRFGIRFQGVEGKLSAAESKLLINILLMLY